ncbi:heparan-alpha-glucosaminide N-acetyltransferase domain-containing protein [Oerskovia flava]|uniref:heparan-alpha-glucosaminide N-acetyltransferase domain-containing protein n=1 Tax=Oerskovia flava TaxID=2986422 RepID=UPI00223F0230|nr:heparan-alpha-glucosaminide N-acetyltransferase domain-containing protein [Oerskovia sp. JB1-3-2]
MTTTAEPPVDPTPQVNAPPAPPAPTVEPTVAPTAPAIPAPGGRRPRLVGIDLARGLAIIGMFGAHTLSTAELGWDPTTWAGVVHGRSSILFATLAGISLALMSGGRRPLGGAEMRDARTRVLVRAALIFALGSVLALFGSVAVILEVYAVLLVVALPFLRWSPRRLFVLAGILAVVGPVARLLVSDALLWWGAYPSGFLDLALTSTYPGLVWIAFVLLGLGVGRLDLTSRVVRTRLVVVGLLLAVAGYAGGWASTRAAGLESAGYGYSSSSSFESDLSGSGSDVLDEGVPGDTIDLSGSTCYPDGDGFVYCEPSGWADSTGDLSDDEWYDEGTAFTTDLTGLVGAEPHTGTPFEVVGSSGIALLVIGLCLLAPRPVRRVLYPVAAAGTMALTLYSLHVVALAFGGSWFADRPTLFFATLVAGALVFAVVWRRLLGQGPLERVVSTVSRRAATVSAPRPPARRGAEAAESAAGAGADEGAGEPQDSAASAITPASSAGRENIGQ